MTQAPTPAPSGHAGTCTVIEPALVPDPYLHEGPDRVYNPLTDRTLLQGERGYDPLRGILGGTVEARDLDPEVLGLLERGGWLVSPEADLDGRFLLKYVSLEAHTVCNQACYFCPVSVDPRESHFMPTELYEDILRQLAAFRHTIEGVFMISYNEPTLDPRFVDQVRAIKSHGLPPAVLSNGGGLTPAKTDSLVELGGLRFLSINLSTLDRERYAKERGVDQLNQVLRNVEYVKDKPVAEQMDIVVLGTGDETHKADHAAIEERFAGSRFNVKYFEVNDRAGYLDVGLRADGSQPRLAGCDYMGSRPLQHLHITPHAKCILCCQDYDEKHVVGDLSQSTVQEVLTGPAMRLMRRWAYGRDASPEDFICHNCSYALRR